MYAEVYGEGRADRRCPGQGKPHPLRGELQGGEDGFGGGVVAEGLAQVGEAVNVAGAKYKGTAELEGIAAELVLAVAGGLGAAAALEIVAAEEMEEIGFAEVGDFVGLAASVDEEGKVDAGFFLEEAGVAGIAEADGGQGSVLFAEGLLVLAQLRDVFAAEDSTVVAEKDNDRGIRLPKGAETDPVAKGIGERDAGESLAESIGHDGP